MMKDGNNETKCVVCSPPLSFIKTARCIPACECAARGLKIKLGHAGKHLKCLHFAALRCPSRCLLCADGLIQNKPELTETGCSVNTLLAGAMLSFKQK